MTRDAPATAPARRPLRTALGIIAAFVLFVATMAAWIGGLIAFNALGIPMTGVEWLGWVIAGLIAAAVWPLAGRRAHREFWARQHHGATPPRAPATTPDRVLRILVMIIGAAGLVALCGPRNITLALAEAWQIIAPGGRSSSALLQLIGLLLCFALMVPPMLITQRSLRRTPRDHPDRLGLELRQNWYVSAATAWVCCLLLGLIVSFVLVKTL
ncbi:hypothetical protein [Microbacterium arborescens]|uniref:hypothetical protein n=1 Tax=Microbacterium arborescens TaxID=33883 RepID=UPI0025A147BF|nr:hypothetical protein [Microbacterium arborescens]WJM14649.1 hypothetical protein QUC20_10175 [Microbacterium arborescens]